MHDVLLWSVPANVTLRGPRLAKATLLLSCCCRRSGEGGGRGNCNYVINFLKACRLNGRAQGTEGGPITLTERQGLGHGSQLREGCSPAECTAPEGTGTPCEAPLLVTADIPRNGARLKGMGTVCTPSAAGSLGKVPQEQARGAAPTGPWLVAHVEAL